MNSISVQDLTKVFVRQKKLPGLVNSIKGLFYRETIRKAAVDHISFDIEPGHIVGFLGPNGAGKTTTLKMLAGILYPTSGKVSILGFTPWERKEEFKKNIGMVMGQKQQLVWDLPAMDSFELFREIYEIPTANYKKQLDRLVTLLDVEDILNIQVRQLSLGQRMKLEIIAALLHRPSVLFLDEPTIGLDIVAQKNIRDFIKSYNAEEKTTILLTSHYMQDVKELCERIIVVNHGQIVYDDKLSKLIADHLQFKILDIVFSEPYKGALEKYGQIIECLDLSAKILVKCDEAVPITTRILNELPIEDINIAEPEAEEVIRELFKNA